MNSLETLPTAKDLATLYDPAFGVSISPGNYYSFLSFQNKICSGKEHVLPQREFCHLSRVDKCLAVSMAIGGTACSERWGVDECVSSFQRDFTGSGCFFGRAWWLRFHKATLPRRLIGPSDAFKCRLGLKIPFRVCCGSKSHAPSPVNSGRSVAGGSRHSHVCARQRGKFQAISEPSPQHWAGAYLPRPEVLREYSDGAKGNARCY